MVFEDQTNKTTIFCKIKKERGHINNQNQKETVTTDAAEMKEYRKYTLYQCILKLSWNGLIPYNQSITYQEVTQNEKKSWLLP